VRFQKIWLYPDPGSGKTSLNEFFARKVCQGHVAAHVVVPGSPHAMNLQHERHGRGHQARIAIATVPYASPQSRLETFFANLSLPAKRPARAQQPVIVQRVHDWNSHFTASL